MRFCNIDCCGTVRLLMSITVWSQCENYVLVPNTCLIQPIFCIILYRFAQSLTQMSKSCSISSLAVNFSRQFFASNFAVWIPCLYSSKLFGLMIHSFSNHEQSWQKITFQKAHETHENLEDFLKDYEFLQTVNNFANAWCRITRKNLRAVWNPLLKMWL